MGEDDITERWPAERTTERTSTSREVVRSSIERLVEFTVGECAVKTPRCVGDDAAVRLPTVVSDEKTIADRTEKERVGI